MAPSTARRPTGGRSPAATAARRQSTDLPVREPGILAGLLVLVLGVVTLASTAGAAEPGEVRVLLGSSTSPVPLPSGSASLRTVEARQGTLHAGGVSLGLPAMTLRPGPGGSGLGFRGRTYAGALHLTAVGDRVRVVNEVPLEEYLRGVVPQEMPADWPDEALNAMAVAARTFAVHQRDRAGARDWDLDATVGSQVYGGLEAHHPRTDRALAATAGQVVTWGGQAILASFHSGSGGHTEAARHVWSEDLPYLQAIPDPASAGSGQAWRATFSKGEIARRLRLGGHPVERVTGVQVIAHSPSGRAATVRVHHRRGALDLRGLDFRHLLGATTVRSTWFEVIPVDGGLSFEGRGFGHGVGLSQQGARALALEGWTYRAILRSYYPGTRIDALNRVRLARAR